MLIYRILADAVVVIHVAFVLFVVCGLLLILVGGLCGWNWVRNTRLRLAHLLAITVVVVQAWLGVICPLTILENRLRQWGGSEPYPGSFIGYWAHELLFFQAPAWVFTLCYTLFGLLVLASLFFVRPHLFDRRKPA
ncbi:MAG: DUF2784 domain-containing protein [Planctomycetota bacterium]|nr:MAG: DUF2784 domain-containing protein [Planctomycetota bacterium]REJ98599.1 MAG: DUF2784 domain-containing protein [Planctomycetota bacterium]REK29899.1 MAG: DUF2784 domain-containing protein [Planctomycetota bacterium]REK47931.1 MAG: DUF2784 domain-containing protein [Planctomycetota bacterium]